MASTFPGECSGLEPLCAVALDVHRFVSHVQRPRLANSAWARNARARCRELSERLAAMRDTTVRRRKAAAEALDRMAESLRAYRAALAGSPTVARLKEFSRRLAEDYEDLRAELREFQRQDGTKAVRLPHVKPVTWARSAFHATMGLTGLVLYHLVLTRGQAVAIMAGLSGLAIALEVTRRFSRRWNAFLMERVFGPVSRPWERHRTNSATWYAFGVTLLAVAMPKTAAEVGLVALALGDPAASLVGRRWGARKLWRDKSFAGTAAFVAVTLSATAALLSLVAPGLPIASRLFLPALVATVGAAAELFSEGLDDNFTIPVLCAGVAALWLA